MRNTYLMTVFFEDGQERVAVLEPFKKQEAIMRPSVRCFVPSATVSRNKADGERRRAHRCERPSVTHDDR